MDPTKVDQIARELAKSSSRRGFLRSVLKKGAAVGVVGSVAAPVGMFAVLPSEAEAACGDYYWGGFYCGIGGCSRNLYQKCSTRKWTYTGYHPSYCNWGCSNTGGGGSIGR